MGKALSVAEAKAHFSECLETALQEGYVLITRYCKPIAAIVDIKELVQLQRLRVALEGGGLADLAEQGGKREWYRHLQKHSPWKSS
jgi:prevent-host-death family protein